MLITYHLTETMHNWRWIGRMC